MGKRLDNVNVLEVLTQVKASTAALSIGHQHILYFAQSKVTHQSAI